MSIVISSGHGLHVRGARGFMDERDENVRVTDRVAAILRGRGTTVHTFHDNASRSVAANLNAIIGFHNGRSRNLDVSVHFNAFRTTEAPMGTEVLHRSQQALATRVSAAMARAGGFRDRGHKHRTNLAFLNRLTSRPSILLEVCFVDSRADTNLYRQNFEAICVAIADSISGGSGGGGGGTSGQRPVIRQGSANREAIREAQGLLNRGPTAFPRLSVDGIFGPLTDRRTREFQAQQGITVDGIIGPITWGRLTA